MHSMSQRPFSKDWASRLCLLFRNVLSWRSKRGILADFGAWVSVGRVIERLLRCKSEEGGWLH